MDLSEAVELLAQIAGAASQILFDVVAIYAEACSRARHELRKAERVLCGVNPGIVRAFPNDHRIEQSNRNPVLARDTAHHAIIAEPSGFGTRI